MRLLQQVAEGAGASVHTCLSCVVHGTARGHLGQLATLLRVPLVAVLAHRCRERPCSRERCHRCVR